MGFPPISNVSELAGKVAFSGEHVIPSYKLERLKIVITFPLISFWETAPK